MASVSSAVKRGSKRPCIVLCPSLSLSLSESKRQHKCRRPTAQMPETSANALSSGAGLLDPSLVLPHRPPGGPPFTPGLRRRGALANPDAKGSSASREWVGGRKVPGGLRP